MSRVLLGDLQNFVKNPEYLLKGDYNYHHGYAGDSRTEHKLKSLKKLYGFMPLVDEQGAVLSGRVIPMFLYIERDISSYFLCWTQSYTLNSDYDPYHGKNIREEDWIDKHELRWPHDDYATLLNNLQIYDNRQEALAALQTLLDKSKDTRLELEKQYYRNEIAETEAKLAKLKDKLKNLENAGK